MSSEIIAGIEVAADALSSKLADLDTDSEARELVTSAALACGRRPRRVNTFLMHFPLTASFFAGTV